MAQINSIKGYQSIVLFLFQWTFLTCPKYIFISLVSEGNSNLGRMTLKFNQK